MDQIKLYIFSLLLKYIGTTHNRRRNWAIWRSMQRSALKTCLRSYRSKRLMWAFSIVQRKSWHSSRMLIFSHWVSWTKLTVSLVRWLKYKKALKLEKEFVANKKGFNSTMLHTITEELTYKKKNQTTMWYDFYKPEHVKSIKFLLNDHSIIWSFFL